MILAGGGMGKRGCGAVPLGSTGGTADLTRAGLPHRHGFGESEE